MLALWALLLGGAAVGRAALTDLLPAVVTDNFEELLNTAAAACEVLPLELIFSRQFTSELPYMEVVEFTAHTHRAHRALHPPAPRAGPAVIYVPGWWNTPSDESTQALVRALLRRHSAVLVLDTRLAFCRGYVGAASRVNAVAHLLYKYITNLVKTGLPLESIHLIGFSLGAHVVGMAGRLVQKNTGGKVGRITALDPARPCFARSPTFRLGKSDARHVQVLHTSAGVLGLATPLGHVDLYVGRSGGKGECGRVQLQCDHARAWRLFAASVLDARALTAARCRGWRELRRARCSGNHTQLGYGCSADTSGMFLMLDKEQEIQVGKLRRSESERQAIVFNPFDVFTWFS